MRIVFFGTPFLAVSTLAAIVEHHEVTAAVCQPDKPKGRGQKFTAPPVKEWARGHGIPVHQPEKLNDGSFEAWLRDQRPDVCVLAAYGRFLREPLLNIPTHGFLNVHPSLLPRYRGPSPIQTALLNGDTVAGVTIMRISMEMDAGDILLQEERQIDWWENGFLLSCHLADLGARLMVEALARVEAGTAVYVPQDESQATYCHIITKATGYIRWARPAIQTHNQVRACFPWPIASFLLGSDQIRVKGGTAVIPSDVFPPCDIGKVIAITDEALHVATGDGILAIRLLQAPGKQSMKVPDFIRGRKINVGDVLGEIGAKCP